MNDETWARVLQVVLEAEDGVDLVAQLIPVMRSDELRYELVEEDGEEVEEPDTDPEQRPAPVKKASKRAAPELEKMARARLDLDTVTQLRTIKFRDHLTYAQLSEKFGVGHSTVAKILARQTYADGPLVPGEPGFEDEDEAREKRIQLRRDRAATSATG